MMITYWSGWSAEKREQLHLNLFTALHKLGFKLYLSCTYSLGHAALVLHNDDDEQLVGVREPLPFLLWLVMRNK